MNKNLLLLILVLLVMPYQVSLGAPPEIEEYTIVPVDEIKLRDPLLLEQAAMEYMLAFEAYVEAKRSKTPETRAKIVRLMKEYRQTYAKFLSLLREDKLYDPQKPKNPAGWYDKKHEKQHGNKREWKKTDAGDMRKKVKEMVKKGATPEEIKAFIKANLPKTAMSTAPLGTTTTTTATRPPVAATAPKTPPPPPPAPTPGKAGGKSVKPFPGN